MTTTTPSFNSYKFLSFWDPSNKESPPLPIVVVTCFIQHRDKVLVLQRARKDEQFKLWGIPGGKLNKNEPPLVGLTRELQEEIKIKFTLEEFQLLATARSRTHCDGEYGLYIYYTNCPGNINIQITSDEHLAYQWVTLDKFRTLKLLTAQGEAFQLVEKKLKNLMTSFSVAI